MHYENYKLVKSEHFLQKIDKVNEESAHLLITAAFIRHLAFFFVHFLPLQIFQFSLEILILFGIFLIFLAYSSR